MFITIELCFINRDSTRPTASNLRWKTTGGWSYPVRLQHTKGINSTFGIEVEGRNADFRKNSNWKDNYPGSGSVRHNRERKGENPRQGRYVRLLYFASRFQYYYETFTGQVHYNRTMLYKQGFRQTNSV